MPHPNNRVPQSEGLVRYAVIGLGHIAQSAILPAFEHARENSRLVALVSGDAEKRRELGKRYKVNRLFDYREAAQCLQDPEIDAVFIAVPNDQHREFAELAAKAGKHILCEKPMAVRLQDAEAMLKAARRARVRMMIAYRLHFEPANLRAIELVQSGAIGEPRVFNSVFTMPVRESNIRVEPRASGGGPVYDIGIYCINAARYLFRAEPLEVTAVSVNSGKERFRHIEEGMSVTMRFPGERIAQFVCSFDGASAANYSVVGTEGDLLLENPYSYRGEKKLSIHSAGEGAGKDEPRVETFPATDQFAPELLYFSDCILYERDPEPDGIEGIQDLRVIDAIFKSDSLERRVPLDLTQSAQKRFWAGPEQKLVRPPVSPPEPVKAQSPSGEKAA